jgi:hypothetical protein
MCIRNVNTGKFVENNKKKPVQILMTMTLRAEHIQKVLPFLKLKHSFESSTLWNSKYNNVQNGLNYLN